MYPELFTINSIVFHALPVFMALGLFVFGINLWKSTREIKNFAFDLFLLNLILNPVIARVAHILLNTELYSNYGWSILPVQDTGAGIELFKAFPWVFFSFWEKGMNFQFMPLVLVLSVIIIRWFRRSKFKELPLAEIWKSFMFGFMVILFGFFLDGSYLSDEFNFPVLLRYRGQEADLFPVHLLEVILLLIGLIFYLDGLNFSTQRLIERFRKIFFPVYWAVVQIGIWFMLADYTEELLVFNTAQIVWIIFLIVAIWIVYAKPGGISKSQSRFGKKIKSKPRQIGQLGGAQENDYSYSFSNYKKGMRTQMSTREKLKQTRNRIKRGI